MTRPVSRQRYRLVSMAWRCAAGLAGLVLLAAGVSWIAGGFIVPPVVISPAHDSWFMVSLAYPKDLQPVEVEVREGPEGSAVVLRGMFTPSDSGAPLVVHFAGSGVSLRSRFGPMHWRHEFEDLSDLGFASLAIDYRGVGASGGRPSPARLGDDARAIWEHALGRVDGDASRIILRGCSLGSIAIAELLQGGVAPAGVIAIAPVEAKTVALRYGLARFPGPVAWLAQPFLRSFSEASTLGQLDAVRCPCLVISASDDELLGSDAFATLAGSMTGPLRTVHAPDAMTSQLPGLGLAGEFMPRHMELAGRASSVSGAEEAFLVAHFREQLGTDGRLARAISSLSEEARVELLARQGAEARLRWFCARRRFLVPEVTAAAACALMDSELEEALHWIPWPETAAEVDTFQGRWGMPFTDLISIFDLDDEAGRISTKAISHAVSATRFIPETETTGRRALDRLEALAEIALTLEPGARVPSRTPGDPATWFFERGEGGAVTYWTSPEVPTPQGIWGVDELVSELRSLPGLTITELEPLIYRCLLKGDLQLVP